MTQLISKQCKDISLGALKNVTDMVLFTLAFGVGLSVSGRSSRGVYEAARFAEGVNIDQIRRAITHLKSKGWIKRDLSITSEGQKRLTTFVPEPRKYPRRWSGIWHLVSFDVPERLAWKRNNLRSALRRMGFGKLHESLWISPYNFLGDVQVYGKEERIKDYILPAISKEVGTRRSKELAEQVWNLAELNENYRRLFEAHSVQKEDQQKLIKLIFTYSALLRKDPFLPVPLLPLPWHGKKAHEVFYSILMQP